VARLGRGQPNRSGGGPHPAVVTQSNIRGAVPTGRTAPTYGTPAQTVLAGGGTKSTTIGGTGSGSLTWGYGDIIVALAVTGDSTVSLATPTATGLAFENVGAAVTTANSCWGQKWIATAGSAGSGAITAVPTPSTGDWVLVAWVVSGSSGVGNTAAAAATAQTISLTTLKDNSAVLEIVGDWGAGSPTGHTWTPSGSTERLAQQDGSNLTVYCADWADRGTAGTTSYGISVTASGQNYTKIAVEMMGVPTFGGPAANGTDPIVSVPLPWPPPVAPPTITSSQPLGNPAVPTPGVEVVQPQFSWPPVTPDAQLFGPGAPATAVSAAGIQPLVVGPGPIPVPVPAVTITASQPLGNPAVGSPRPLVVGVPYTPIPVPGALLSANPAGFSLAPQPLVIGPPNVPVPIPPVLLSASQPLGNPAVGTPPPLVVGDPYTLIPVPGALLSGNPTAPVISTTASPAPLVVGPANLPVPIPRAIITWSAPLGNPAAPTPGPLVVGPPPAPAPVPRATITASSATTSSAGLLVVTPTFTLAPVPGAKVLSAPTAPTTPAIGTPGPLVVTPPFTPVPIPRTLFSSNRPLGNPAVGGRQPLVVGPPHRWPRITVPLLSGVRGLVAICSTPRPNTGTTSRPSSGTTAYALAATTRPTTGITARPNSGSTEDPC
jgi:hypothetical protein